MILRRDGDSHLVNDESENELQGARNPCREMTHENSRSVSADADEKSDVAGCSSAAVVDERRVASSIGLPRCGSVKSQKSAQVPMLHCVVHVSLEGTEKLHNLFTLVVQCRSL